MQGIANATTNAQNCRWNTCFSGVIVKTSYHIAQHELDGVAPKSHCVFCSSSLENAGRVGNFQQCRGCRGKHTPNSNPFTKPNSNQIQKLKLVSGLSQRNGTDVNAPQSLPSLPCTHPPAKECGWQKIKSASLCLDKSFIPRSCKIQKHHMPESQTIEKHWHRRSAILLRELLGQIGYIHWWLPWMLASHHPRLWGPARKHD